MSANTPIAMRVVTAKRIDKRGTIIGSNCETISQSELIEKAKRRAHTKAVLNEA
jgi:hypothetical protein